MYNTSPNSPTILLYLYDRYNEMLNINKRTINISQNFCENFIGAL